MAIKCGNCGRQYDVTLFEFGRKIRCACGMEVELRHEEMSGIARHALRIEDEKVREIRDMADRISSMIVGSDYPMFEIEQEKQRLRERIAELFPDKAGLYELIYEPRFRRLEEQFRGRSTS